MKKYNFKNGRFEEVPVEDDVQEKVGSVFNPETGEILRFNQTRPNNIPKSNVIKSIQENSMHKPAVERIDEHLPKKSEGKIGNKRKFWIGVITAAAITVTSIWGIPKLAEMQKDFKLSQELQSYYGQFKYTYVIPQDNGKNNYAYRNDWTAEYLATNETDDIDTMIYYIYSSYDYEPERQMDEVFSFINHYDTPKAEEIKKYDNFEEYIKDLGFDSIEEYKKEYAKIALEDVKEHAIAHFQDSEYPIQYDVEKKVFVVSGMRWDYNPIYGYYQYDSKTEKRWEGAGRKNG